MSNCGIPDRSVALLLGHSNVRGMHDDRQEDGDSNLRGKNRLSFLVPNPTLGRIERRRLGVLSTATSPRREVGKTGGGKDSGRVQEY